MDRQSGFGSELLELIKSQHEHFGISYPGSPRSLSVEEKRFRVCCMTEEVMEYLTSDNIEDEYDSLLDLLVFTLGTLERSGLTLDGLVDVVNANKQKELGPNSKRGGFELDLRKPEGWQPPSLERHLR